jgi:serralysin
MNPEFTHEQVIERLETSFVVPFFQPGAGMHANWEDTTLTYRIDTEYDGTQKAAARQAFELWDDLIASSLSEVTTTNENIYFERNMSLGSLVRHIDPILWAGGALAGGLVGAGLVAAGGAPAIFLGSAFFGAVELTAAILGAVAAAGSVEPLKDLKIFFDSAFSPIKTDDFDFDFNDQTRIDYATVHIGDNAALHVIGGNDIPLHDLTAPGEHGFETYVHEIGHALGLTHPGPYNGTAPPRDDPAVYAQDTTRFSIMSYFEEADDGSATSWIGSRPSTPMLHDVLAIQAKYGADPNTRTGDTVYGFNSTANRTVFDFAINKSPVVTIYDAGGIDTLDTSGFGDPGFGDEQTIDLRVNKVGQSLAEEKFSSIGGLTNNVAIAYNVVIENAVGGSGRDTITGNEADNKLSGLSGADTLTGGDGDDTLDGGRGSDVMDGGLGDDTYRVDSAADVVFEATNAGVDEIVTDMTVFTLPDPRSGGAFIENLTYVGRQAFTGTGNVLTNRITGGIADDTLNGGEGRDFMIGRRGNDTYLVDMGRDVVIEDASNGIDTVRSRVSLTLYANTENLILEGNASNGTGNALRNTITGNARANVLDGAGGVDTLIGRTGNDVYVTDGGDSVVEQLNQGIDLVRSSASFELAANVEKLTLTGTANSKGVGNGLNNAITGNSGANHVFGLFGNDVLTGGAGADTFHFDTQLDRLKNVDHIVDFNVVNDRIALENTIFTALGANGTLSAGAFFRGEAAHDASDRIIYNADNGHLIYDSNGNAAGGAVLFATLAPNLQLASNDFLVV